jgi:hypothetical protein
VENRFQSLPFKCKPAALQREYAGGGAAFAPDRETEADGGGGGGGGGGDGGGAAAIEWRRLNMLFMQLRKCCNHPYLFPNAEPDFDGSTDEDLVSTSVGLCTLNQVDP